MLEEVMGYKLALTNIKTLLKIQGRSITSLAVEMELSNETLSNYINGCATNLGSSLVLYVCIFLDRES